MQISHNVRSTEWIQGEVAVREPSVFFATVRLMTGLQKIFQEDVYKRQPAVWQTFIRSIIPEKRTRMDFMSGRISLEAM